MISNFNQFINESESKTPYHTQNDDVFHDILQDMIDDGFVMEIERTFANFDDEHGRFYTRNRADVTYKTPSYDIKIYKETKHIDMVSEATSRISDLGKCQISRLEIENDGYCVMECILIDKESKEVEVNYKDGFDAFIKKLFDKFNKSYSKFGKTFTMEETKEGVVFTPKETDPFWAKSYAKKSLSEAKAFVKSAVKTTTRILGRSNWVYKYDVELKGDKIYVNYLKRVDDMI